MKRLLHPALLLLTLVFALACSDDEPTETPPPISTLPPATGTAVASTPTPGRVDGTVDPSNIGGTDPVIIPADPLQSIAVLIDVRVGAHPEDGGWDRIVFEFQSGLPASMVSYDSNVIQCGSGIPVSLPGAATLVVQFEPAQAHNDAGNATIRSNDISGPGNAILRSRQICDFEAVVEWAIGLRDVQPFKVTKLTNPTRLVVDIKSVDRSP
jgi:hypothetical protein